MESPIDPTLHQNTEEDASSQAGDASRLTTGAAPAKIRKEAEGFARPAVGPGPPQDPPTGP